MFVPTLLLTPSSLLSLLLLQFSAAAAGNELKITNKDDFHAFLNSVSNGTTYSGTTVLLDSDLSLSGVSKPIGDYHSFFSGVFDGQGHIISSLNIHSNSSYAGLFGYSKGTTIKNVVLDSSCSITNVNVGSSGPIYTGGIIGYCVARNSQCIIENNVNMGSVTFSGNNPNRYLYLGGIAGCFYYTSYKIHVKNCANYGSIMKFGPSLVSYIGGISGRIYSGYYKYIRNCLNHGTITHIDTTSKELNIGGIAGYTHYAHVENCVSAGNMVLSHLAPTSYIGSIVGHAYYFTTIDYCYYSNELNDYDTCGHESSPSISGCTCYDSSSFELNGTVSINGQQEYTLIGALNAASDHYAPRGYSHWLLNTGSKGVSFTINGRPGAIEMDRQIILMPSLGNEGSNTFNGWYSDSGCTRPLLDYEISGDTPLYGNFGENTNTYTISFETRRSGLSVEPVAGQYGTAVVLPSDPSMSGCSIAFWETSCGDRLEFAITMPPRNTTLRAVWKCTYIATADDYADFAKVVNAGADNFKGTTVYLDSDLSLPEISEPIGKDDTNYFLGVFDGQGHVISDLAINPQFSYHIGLFGYTRGLTIKNVILDSTCSVSSSYRGTHATFEGSFIGYCSPSFSDCKVMSSVNMANVTFNGNIYGNGIHIGGIVGDFQSSLNYKSYVTNCVNYGSVTHSGSSSASYIGGITGFLGSSYNKFLYNCLNYGAITHSGISSNNLQIGGITGYSYYSELKNCLSAGKIVSNDISTYIGSLIGNVNDEVSVFYCYYINELTYDKYGNTSYLPIESKTPDSPTLISTAVGDLNGYSSSNGWNKWLFNANSKIVTFKINNYNGFSLSSQAIIYPSLTDGDRKFVGWFDKSSFSTQFSKSTILDDTTLYGRWDKYRVWYNANGGSIPEPSVIIEYGKAYENLPTPTREGHTFSGWFTEVDGGTLVNSSTTLSCAYDHTLYAHWTINNYTLMFIFNNGTAPDVRIITFNGIIIYPGNSTRKGYTFSGWDSNITVMPARDINITAQWTKDPSSGKGSVAIIIAVSICTGIALVVIVALFIFVILNKKGNDDDRRIELSRTLIGRGSRGGRPFSAVFLSRTTNGSDKPSRAAAMTKDDTVRNATVKSIKSIFTDLYPEDYARPTMREALLQAELTEKQADDICDTCMNSSQAVMNEYIPPDEFTDEDAAAIAMYTYDFGGKSFEKNPYRIINKGIVEGNYINLQKMKGLLYLVMTALRKLPRVTGITLYRGVKNEVNLDEGHYCKGNIVTWMALSSTSPDMETTKSFLSSKSKGKKSKGTLFIIENGWGYNIQPYSMFPEEAEILLEPERQFRVKSVILAEGLTFINLQMLDTPLSIPNVFGEGEKK